MKKIYLVLLFAGVMGSLSAQGVFREYFGNATSGADVEGYNDWFVSFKSADAMGVSPVINDETLYYDDYIGSGVGKVAVLDSLMGQTDDTKRISTKYVTLSGDTLELGVAGNVMYAAFIVKILPNSWHSYRDFFTWEGSSTGSWTRGRVFVKLSDDNQDVQYAVSKNSSSDLAEGDVLAGEVELEHLLVLKYEVVEGDANDIVSLYVNPDPTLAESAQTAPLVNIDTQSDYNVDTEIKINLRQRGTGAKVGGIRVGKVWEEVLAAEPLAIDLKPEAAINSIHSFGQTIFTSGSGSVHVYDLTGRKVMSEMTSGSIETNLNSGIYIVRFEDHIGNAVTGKVVLK